MQYKRHKKEKMEKMLIIIIRGNTVTIWKPQNWFVGLKITFKKYLAQLKTEICRKDKWTRVFNFMHEFRKINIFHIKNYTTYVIVYIFFDPKAVVSAKQHLNSFIIQNFQISSINVR